MFEKQLESVVAVVAANAVEIDRTAAFPTKNLETLASNGLLSTLKLVGSHRAGGVGYGTIPVQEMIAPEFQLAGYSLKNVPVDVRADSSNPPGGALFLNVLSRFNTILDYQNNMAYFRPNSHFNDPYPTHGPSSAILFIGCSILVLALAGTAMYRVKRRKPPAS